MEDKDTLRRKEQRYLLLSFNAVISLKLLLQDMKEMKIEDFAKLASTLR